jgi:hypothetical protein
MDCAKEDCPMEAVFAVNNQEVCPMHVAELLAVQLDNHDEVEVLSINREAIKMLAGSTFGFVE